MPWDPDQYGLFSGPRTRPALDLLRSFGVNDPEYVVDLGCGTGHLTAILAERWPAARVEEADSYLREYRSRISRHYPALPDGTTLFPFTRLFIVAQRRNG
jgi:trans-aconitate 2-methyltransferase